MLAKSNMAEWAFSPYQTLSSTAGVTANPYDLNRVPAGSSGGTAAAVAAGAAAAIFTRSAGIADMGIGALAVMGACLVASGAVSASDVALVKAVFTRRV